MRTIVAVVLMVSLGGSACLAQTAGGQEGRGVGNLGQGRTNYGTVGSFGANSQSYGTGMTNGGQGSAMTGKGNVYEPEPGRVGSNIQRGGEVQVPRNDTATGSRSNALENPRAYDGEKGIFQTPPSAQLRRSGNAVIGR